MPCVIPEILFDIGKQLLDDGDSEAVIRFALSGRKPMEAMMSVFATITTLEIYDNKIAVGWDKQCTMFDYKKLPKCLLSFIGGYVKQLYIEREIHPLCQKIIDRIMARKQLISFSAGSDSYYFNGLFLNKFLPLFSATLKDLTIPSRTMSDCLRDSLSPESLTFTKIFNLHFPTLIKILSNVESSSSFKSAVKELTLIDKSGTFHASFESFINLFSSLEILRFAMKYNGHIKRDIHALENVIKQSKKFFSSNVVYTVFSDGNCLTAEIESNLAICKDICKGFEYISTNPTFHCFHHFVRTAAFQQVHFEVWIPKRQKLTSEVSQWIS